MSDNLFSFFPSKKKPKPKLKKIKKKKKENKPQKNYIKKHFTSL